MTTFLGISLLLVVGLAGYSYAIYLAPCAADSDCTLSGEQCLTLSALGCSKGYCTCKTGMDYNFNKTRCTTNLPVSLGEVCVGADFEKHVTNAGCYLGISTCFFGYTRSGSACNYNLGKTCTTSDDCGTSSPMTCTSGTCQCSSGYKKSSTTGECVLKDGGDSCTTDSECWALSPSTGTGYACVSGKCNCSSGYNLVTITDVDVNEADASIKATTASYCFSTSLGSTFTAAKGGSCQIWPYSQAASKVTACDTSNGCYVCPEDTSATFGYGYCRTKTATTPSCTSISGCTSTSSSSNAQTSGGSNTVKCSAVRVEHVSFALLPASIMAVAIFGNKL